MTQCSPAGRGRSSSTSTRTRAWRRGTRPGRRTSRSGCCAGYTGTELAEQTASIASVTCPFTGEELAAVKALRPDVGIIHAQQADRAGNVQMWGITGVQKETVLASRRAIVTVEEIVSELELRPGGVVLPSWALDAVCVAPGGAHPSYAHDYYERDNAFYLEWDSISRDRDVVPGLDAAPRAGDSGRRRVPRLATSRSVIERHADVHVRRDDGRLGRPPPP